MMYSINTLNAVVELALARAAEQWGITSGEVTRHEAIKLYGKWFTEEESKGNISPIRVGKGIDSKARKTYRIADILALKAAQRAQADIQLTSLHNN